VKQTLEVRVAGRTVSARRVAAIVLAIFLGVTGAGMSLGHWRNDISAAEYLQRFERLDQPAYQHARGHVPNYGASD
jgi:hypothetical protein